MQLKLGQRNWKLNNPTSGVLIRVKHYYEVSKCPFHLSLKVEISGGFHLYLYSCKVNLWRNNPTAIEPAKS